MTDHKFTDEELQKCMECCIKAKSWGDCEEWGCPATTKQGCRFYLRTDDDYENTIYIEILKDALDLIKRQKAEIEEQDQAIIKALKRMGEIRAEAIKEFAEKLKKRNKVYCTNEVDLKEMNFVVEQTAKEMMEGNNGISVC